MKALKVAMFGLRGHFPDVFWDGYANGERAEGPQICVQGASGVVNAVGPNKFKNPTSDAKPFFCSLEPLPAVVFILPFAPFCLVFFYSLIHIGCALVFTPVTTSLLFFLLLLFLSFFFFFFF